MQNKIRARDLKAPRQSKKNYLPEIIAVTSGKGGVGKSSISVNISILFSQMKRRVLLIDADIHLGSLDLILGIKPRHTISDVLAGKIDLQDAIIPATGGIDVLPAASAVSNPVEMEDVLVQRFAEAFEKFEHNYDLFVLDTGAGIAKLVTSFVLMSDKILLIVTPDPASIADAYSMIKIIRRTICTLPIIMLTNMVKSHEEGNRIYQKMNLMVQKFLQSGIEYGGSIQKDNLIAKSVKFQQPFVLEQPNSTSSKALRLVNHNLLKIPVVENVQNNTFIKRLMVNKEIEIEI